MRTVNNTPSLQLKLLSSIDLDDVTDCVSEIIDVVVGSLSGTAVLMWDPDLESFGDRFYFGPKKRDLSKLCDLFVEEFDQSDEELLSELTLKSGTASELKPAFCFRIKDDDGLCACILMFGADEIEEEEATAALKALPFAPALKNAWEYRELQHENKRLRDQYEQMEDKTSMLEEQTMKLIHDFTARDTMRTRHLEREKMVYWISNAVRSSVHIQEVLDTTVERLGTTLGLSRCVLLRAVENADQVQVFEFTKQIFPSVRELFLGKNGSDFTRVALTQTRPEVLIDPELDSDCVYDQTFLKTLGIRSGLVVPIIMRQKVLGVLFLQDCVEARAWSIDDISLIGSLADHLSVAIENAELHQERERQAVIDGLTGVANRRSFNEMLAREYERARRYDHPLSLVMIDLDHLKKINDTYGHQAGDEAIRAIGTVLRQSSRSVDLPARYGGEEFCVLLPNTEIDMAEQLAERLRRLINEVEIPQVGFISASIGVATFPQHADDPDLLLKRADEALYVAKQAGRNQVKTSTAVNVLNALPQSSGVATATAVATASQLASTSSATIPSNTIPSASSSNTAANSTSNGTSPGTGSSPSNGAPPN
jgi:diguanylate cyclase (GGDEF)-like protein